jgi:hypothetical protein
VHPKVSAVNIEPPDQLTVEVARWLTSHSGLQAVSATTAAFDAGSDEFAVTTRLRRDGVAPASARAVVAAARARQKARDRWIDADRLLFTSSALEQASDPEVAAWRARRMAGERVWDLCAGIGGDTLAIGKVAMPPVTAVDLDAARIALLEHNARTCGVEVTTLVGDALTVRSPAGAVVHVDPARREGGRRLRRLAELVPAVPAVLAAHRGTTGMAVVLSPGVDLSDPDLPADAELEFVQVGPHLRESVLWLRSLRDPAVQASATLLPEGVSRARDRRPPRLEVGEVGEHLVEVATAAVRARLHDTIGAEIGARRIATGRALLTCDDVPPPSPWYRVRHVLALLPARPRPVRAWLREHPPPSLELAVHGLDLDPLRWWRELGRPPRGPRGWRLELVRTDDGGRAIVTAPVED